LSDIQPSLKVCKPTYFEPVPKPGNREGCGRKGIRCKNALGCMAGLTHALVGVAVAYAVAGVSERGPAIN